MRLPLTLPPAGSRPRDVLTAGSNSMDLLAVVDPYPPPNSKQQLAAFEWLPGGQAASAAVALARLGWQVEYIGRFGDDQFGREGKDSLAREGVFVDRTVLVPSAASRFAIILVARHSGERTVLWDRPPEVALAADDVPNQAIDEARVLLVDCQETAGVTSSAERARRSGTRTVIDVEAIRPGIEALLRQTDVIIAAEQFPSQMTGKPALGAALEALQRESGAAIVCATLGEQGSLTRSNGVEIRTPAFAVDVVDTTGAGDTFRAGFIAGWLRAGDAAELEQVLSYASAVAALKCRALGARAGAPRRDEVEAFLASGPSRSRA